MVCPVLLSPGLTGMGVARLSVLGLFEREGQVTPRYFLLEHLFYVLQLRLLCGADERDCPPLLACPGCSAYSVDIVFGVVGHVVVEDERYVVYVDAARQEVGGYKNVGVARAEVLHHLLTLGLGEVGVYGFDVVSLLLQLGCYVPRLLLGGTEDYCPCWGMGGEEVVDYSLFVVFLTYVYALADAFGRF